MHDFHTKNLIVYLNRIVGIPMADIAKSVDTSVPYLSTMSKRPTLKLIFMKRFRHLVEATHEELDKDVRNPIRRAVADGLLNMWMLRSQLANREWLDSREDTHPYAIRANVDKPNPRMLDRKLFEKPPIQKRLGNHREWRFQSQADFNAFRKHYGGNTRM